MTSEDSTLSRRGFLKLFVLGPLLLQCPFPDLAAAPEVAVSPAELTAIYERTIHLYRDEMVRQIFGPNPMWEHLNRQAVRIDGGSVLTRQIVVEEGYRHE